MSDPAEKEQKLRDALIALLAVQPRCDLCVSLATRGSFSGNFCDNPDHGFSSTPDLKTAPAIQQALQALAETT